MTCIYVRLKTVLTYTGIAKQWSLNDHYTAQIMEQGDRTSMVRDLVSGLKWSERCLWPSSGKHHQISAALNTLTMF